MVFYLVRRLFVVLLGAIVILPTLVGCDSGGGGLQSLAIDPAEVTMQSRGENVQLQAIGKRADGTTVPEDSMDLRWTYSDGSIASVDKSGLLRGVLAGEGTVTVKSERYGMQTTIKVHVLPPKFTAAQMQQKVQQVIDGIAALDTSGFPPDQSLIPDVKRSLTEAHKYIGQGTNNTLASVELLNAAQYMEIMAGKTTGALADGLTQQAKLARQYREELFAY
ncbi:MAG: Ig-like domain-containing protein [Chloroflexota bacterium]